MVRKLANLALFLFLLAAVSAFNHYIFAPILEDRFPDNELVQESVEETFLEIARPKNLIRALVYFSELVLEIVAAFRLLLADTIRHSPEYLRQKKSGSDFDSWS